MKAKVIWYLISFLHLITILQIGYSQIVTSNIQITPFRAQESSVFIHPDNPNIVLISNNPGNGVNPFILNTWYSLVGVILGIKHLPCLF